MKKKTLVLGASPNPARYAHMAATQLIARGHEVVLLGKKKGEVSGVNILNTAEELPNDIHTVTLYLSAENQAEYATLLVQLKPKRVVFNPGAENPTLRGVLRENGIETLEACTLVLLSTGQY